MKLKVKKTVEVEVKFLQVGANVRYWEDASVNGEEDTNGDLIPLRVGNSWKPCIHVDTGQIYDWPQGTKAFVHYKVCDEGIYQLLDDKDNVMVEKEGYVPNCLSPKRDGYGDYIILEIDETGKIDGWKPDFSDFKGVK